MSIVQKLGLTSVLALGSTLAVTHTHAQSEGSTPGKSPDGSGRAMVAGEVITVTATVEAVDVEKREVTLKYPDGHPETLLLSEDVRNLPQVKVGDTVTVSHRQAVAIYVTSPEQP